MSKNKEILVVLAVVLFASAVFAAEPVQSLVDGNEVWFVTEGNLDEDGNLKWQFESGKVYLLRTNVYSGFIFADVDNIVFDLNGFKIQGNWDPSACTGTATSCSSFGSEEGCDGQAGCSWSLSYCHDSPGGRMPCDFWGMDISDCEWAGCSWGGGCSGSFTCSDYDHYQNYCTYIGCDYNHPYCTGVPTFDCDIYDNDMPQCIEGQIGYPNPCTWTGCVGTPVSCESYNPSYCADDCALDWEVCIDNPTPCSSFYDQGGCENQAGCFWVGKVGISVFNCSNIAISNGRVQGFSVGVAVEDSEEVSLSRVTSVGDSGSLVVYSSSGLVSLTDCVFGTTGENKVTASLFVSFGGVIAADECVFIGGKVRSNSKEVYLSNCQFVAAQGSVFTEVQNGEVLNAEPSLAEFVAYLSDKAVMFGTDWCGYCKKQKELFGDAFSGVNYYDCTLNGIDDDEKKATMEEIGVKAFPTWLINGELHRGMKTIAELTALSGYTGKF